MLDNAHLVKSVARGAFPGVGVFSSDWRAKMGQWDAYITTGKDVAWLTVRSGRDLLEARKGFVCPPSSF